MSNPCIRCGKERIVVRTYKEYAAGHSLVIHTITACPDAVCQTAVEKKFEEERKRKEALRNRKN